MVLSFVLAAFEVVVLIITASIRKGSRHGSDEMNCANDVEVQPAKGAAAARDPRTRHEVHEVSAVAEESGRGGAADTIVQTGSAECPEVHASIPGAARVGLRQVQRRGSRNGSVGSDEQDHSKTETSCGGEDERPTAGMLQNLPEEARQYHDHTGNNLDQVLNQPELAAATTGRGPHEHAEDGIMNLELDRLRTEERHRETEAEEEMKSASKFSYFSTGMAGAGIVSIFSGYLGNETGHAHTVHLKVCTFFMLATFVSGASMVLLTLLRLSSHIYIEIFRSLKYTTLGFLTLAMFDVSILFLKKFAILAFVPTLFVVVIAIILTLCHNGLRCSQHQGNSGRSFDRLSDAV